MIGIGIVNQRKGNRDAGSLYHHLSMWLKGLFKQREGNMNTIQLVNSMGDTVTYTDSELTTIIGNGVKSAEKSVELSDKIRDVKYQVRDFFSELEWENSEATITRSEVNKLLKSIGCDILRGEYKATITITAYVTGYEAEDADDAADCIADDIEVSIGSSADIRVDNIEVDDIEDDN
jgi:hypothetical protein